MSETDTPKFTTPLPVCPYCNTDPMIPDCIPTRFGTLIGRMFICSNRECRKLFNVELIGEDKPQIHLPGTPRR